MKGIGVIVLVAVILIGGFLVFGQKKNTASDNIVENTNTIETSKSEFEMSNENTDSSDISTDTNDTNTDEVKAPKEDVDAVFSPFKTVTLKANNFSYFVTEVRVKKGDTVKMVLVNEEGLHDVVIDEFNVATEKIGAGETDSFEFVADKVGTFEYYCSVGAHRAQGMVGKLIVE